MSFAPFARVRDLSKTFTLTASGVKPDGTVQLSDGVVPVLEIATLVGNGAGAAGRPARLGVTAVATSVPFWNVSVQLPSRLALKAVVWAQKVGCAAMGPPWFGLNGEASSPPPIGVLVRV